MIGWLLLLVLKALAVLLIALLAFGWMQNFHPAFDSFSHFRHIFIAMLLLVTVLLLMFTPWVWAALAFTTLAISVAISFPYLPGLGPGTKLTSNTETELRVMQFNLRFNNEDINAMTAAIFSEKADIVLMQELTPLNFELLDRLKERFPYQLECNSKSNGSVALVSRHPFVKLGQQQCLRKLGFVYAQIDVDGRKLTVAGFHSKWPWPDRQFFQIGALEEFITGLETPLVLAGDFNAAPWSAAVHRFARLSKTQVVKGVILSWKPMWKDRRDVMPALLPLDQIMASGDLIPIARRRMQNGGSDHLPVLTEFEWKN